MSVTLSLPDEVSATVISAENGKIVLRCRDGLEDVVNTRRAALRITISEAQGIKIPDKALHRDESGTFVYVMRAGLAERSCTPATDTFLCARARYAKACR